MKKRILPVKSSKEDNKPLSESRQSLWPLSFGLVIWMLHFLLSYITAAVWCAKVAGNSGSLEIPRIAIGVYTLLALLGIGLIAWRAYQRHFGSTAVLPKGSDLARDRFLAVATLLLCSLSFVATLFVALAIVFIGDCR